MKRLLFVLPVLALSFNAVAYDSLLGVLTSTGTSVNQGTTAVTFTVPAGVSSLAIQCDASACVKVGLGSSTAASCAVGNANQGVQVSQGQLYDIPMAHIGTNAVDTIAMVSVSGTANCAVFQSVSGP